MLFYKYTYSHNGEMIEEKTRTDFDVGMRKSLKMEGYECSQFCEELEHIEFYILNKSDEYMSFLCVFNGNLNELHTIDKFADELVLKLNLDMVIAQRIEISAGRFLQELHISEDNGYIPDLKSIRDHLNLHFTGGMWFKEHSFFEKEFSKGKYTYVISNDLMSPFLCSKNWMFCVKTKKTKFYSHSTQGEKLA